MKHRCWWQTELFNERKSSELMMDLKSQKISIQIRIFVGYHRWLWEPAAEYWTPYFKRGHLSWTKILHFIGFEGFQVQSHWKNNICRIWIVSRFTIKKKVSAATVANSNSVHKPLTRGCCTSNVKTSLKFSKLFWYNNFLCYSGFIVSSLEGDLYNWNADSL